MISLILVALVSVIVWDIIGLIRLSVPAALAILFLLILLQSPVGGINPILQ